MNPAIEWLEAEFDKVEFCDVTSEFAPGHLDGLRIIGPVYEPLNVVTRPMIQFMDAARQSDEFHRETCTICNDPAEVYAREREIR